MHSGLDEPLMPQTGNVAKVGFDLRQRPIQKPQEVLFAVVWTRR